MSSTEQPTPAPTRRLRLAVLALVALFVGVVGGFALAFVMPAHVDIAGSHAKVWLEPGHDYDEFGVQGLVSLKRATSRSLAGEPIGVQIVLDLDASQLVDVKGQFQPGVLPAYIQAYS